MHLHFCQWNRRAAIQTVRTYRDGFSKRLLPVFNNIHEEANEAAQKAWEDAMATPFNDDGFDDPSGFAEASQDVGLEVYQNLTFVKQQLLGLALAGLYHLWERTLRQFIIQELRHYQLEEKTFEAIAKDDFKGLSELILQFGYDIMSSPHYKALNELRLVANTVKHGEGKSFNELVECAPHLFDFTPSVFKGKHTFDDLKLTPGIFQTYSEAVEIFWTLFPERLHLEEKSK